MGFNYGSIKTLSDMSKELFLDISPLPVSRLVKILD